jgi:hypothetical protein
MGMGDSFETTVDQMIQLVNRHLVPTIEWYENNRLVPQLLFRTSGLVVVIGSLSLPVISTSGEWRYKTLIIGAVSLTIAVCSSLATFFHWDSVWRSRTNAATQLRGLLAQWELDLAAARTKSDPQAEAVGATYRLFSAVTRIVGMETESFFADLKFPPGGVKS